MNSQHLNEKKSHLGVDYFEKMHIIKNRKEDEVAIMLIQFNFKNFRSFREEATLDLSATKMTEFSERVVTIGREKILPVAAIYGANARSAYYWQTAASAHNILPANGLY